VNCGSGHIQCYCCSAYSGFNIQLNVSALLLQKYFDISMRVVLQLWSQKQRTSSSSCYVYCGPRHLQCICSSGCSGFNIKLNVSALLVDTCRHFGARYTANLLPNTAHILQFMLCDLWSRPYTKYLQLRIFSP
jgi:hypothetical protein